MGGWMRARAGKGGCEVFVYHIHWIALALDQTQKCVDSRVREKAWSLC